MPQRRTRLGACSGKGASARVHITNRNSWTPVNVAADGSHVEVVKLLVETGADITVANNDSWAPIHSAANNGHYEVVKFLVEKGADVRAANNNG
ncbi:hypothetical protein VTI28DRAFT_1714 [Corynascus sepedonium]